MQQINPFWRCELKPSLRLRLLQQCFFSGAAIIAIYCGYSLGDMLPALLWIMLLYLQYRRISPASSNQLMLDLERKQLIWEKRRYHLLPPVIITTQFIHCRLQKVQRRGTIPIWLFNDQLPNQQWRQCGYYLKQLA